MKELLTADKIHVSAADSWISLGNLEKAADELTQISGSWQNHPDVLQVRWHLAASHGDWDSCVRISTELTQMTPERSFGWLHLALSLRRLSRFREAIHILRDGIEQCGDIPVLHLSLACCHARLGSLSRARKSLKRTLDLIREPHARNRFLLRAFDEMDLAALWQSAESEGLSEKQIQAG
jgi:predicted Zn-dependent protease